MVCYMDMTFCPFWVDCADACHWGREYTQEVIDGAKEWWGSDEAPIALYREPPECHREIENGDV